MSRPRHFLTIGDLTRAQLLALLQDAAASKRDRRYGARALAGRIVALVFQKPSMRTRVAFEVAVWQQGGVAIYLGHDDVQLGQREPAKDAARVLSRYADAIVARTFTHRDVEELAQYASVPVINGLSDQVHPCQALADLLTLQQQFKRLDGVRLAYIGDGNNVLHSLAEACAVTGVSLAAACPKGYQPDQPIWQRAVRLGKAHGAALTLAASPRDAARGADVLYTDVWVSMGQESERRKRQQAFRGYQVNPALLKAAKPGCRVMHCLPAHRGEEITDDVMEGKHSLIFEQAENRLHVQKALLRLLLTKGR